MRTSLVVNTNNVFFANEIPDDIKIVIDNFNFKIWYKKRLDWDGISLI